MRRTISVLLFLFVLAAANSALQSQEVAYERYELPNGMTVILHEDHSVPQAVINIWYYVASKDEPEGRSGFAHLFEHLMFMGTRRVPGGNFDTIMEAGGGSNNATTSQDRTNYFSSGPAELLPTLLWLDADRLEDLGREMTAEKLEKQRAVVRNERRQSYENRPYGRADLKVYELMYPEGHPYHIPVIGTHEDLEAATVDDVKNFFSTYYVPNNASLVVAGDFDPEVIKPVIDEWFGTLPRGADVVHAQAEPVRLDAVKRFTMPDRVQFARTTFTYHSPSFFQPGDAEMDLVAAILADGVSSRLYRRLVTEDKLALDVSAYQSSAILGSLFQIEATAAEGVDLAQLERTMDEVIAKFTREGPTAEELEKQKARLEFLAISRLQSLLGKADRLNTYQFFFGEPDSFKRDMDRYRSATARQVRDWSRKVLTPDARLILRVVPEIEAPETNPREAQPQIAAAAKFEPPLPKTFRLQNGVTVHHWERTELPLVALRLMLPAGSTSDPEGRAGLAALTADMLDEGAAGRSATEFADALDLLGANLFVSAGMGETFVTLNTLTRNFEPALELMADAIRRPTFDGKEWERVHNLHVKGLIRAQDQPGSVARNVSMRAYFGDEHPYSRPVGGTPESAEAITLDQVKQHYGRMLRPEGAVILSAGDIKTADLEAKLNAALGRWVKRPGAEPLPRVRHPEPAAKKFQVVVVDRPEAVQTVVRFVMPGPVYSDPKRPEYRLFGTILGGSFTSRLNQNLREDKGYTYGAGCFYSMDPEVGYVTAFSRVRADVTGASVGEFLKEFRGIRGGDVSEEEARKARSTERSRMIGSFAGLNGILDTATTLVRNGRPFSDLGEELSKASRVSQADLNGIARQAVPLESGVLVLVGDKKMITEQLDGLELPPPVERTVSGDVVEKGEVRASGKAAD